ncbi:hypothetical protein [Burkholderia vietnamiensis]|uniref:hypothetical protein n=1 Tax=Burkholderia vietnamiensis TaxID=60552 RepID=UPI00352D25F8
MDERKMFEAFATKRDMGIATISCGRYKSSYTQAMWECWQAARRTTPDREAIIEECAKVCDDRIMGDQSEGDFESKRCAEAIRALKTAATISPRDTLIEEIAEMVDHMGEGRRLEEYVGAIREMKEGKS